MLLAAALLVFSFPQNAVNGATSVNVATVVTDAAKADVVKTDSSNASLPMAPVPKTAGDDSANATGESSSLAAEPIQPAAPIQPAMPPKRAIRGVRYEAPRQKIAWIGLSVLGHGAAAFDAYSTRQAIQGGFGTESNPLLRPFAHSNALYVATQVSPALMDFIGHKMMKSNSPMIRKMWWIPQAAGAGISFSAGVHNMSLVK
ncbi:MAG: hypothetical protein JSS69_02385 [Acidobacteria bacterium]|nr:hypothetical protein [Acidobacteriota bacterium]MBS1864742.1 hypothetical protein [Acidobacteriota bacterium]